MRAQKRLSVVIGFNIMVALQNHLMIEWADIGLMIILEGEIR